MAHMITLRESKQPCVIHVIDITYDINDKLIKETDAIKRLRLLNDAFDSFIENVIEILADGPTVSDFNIHINSAAYPHASKKHRRVKRSHNL